MSPSPWCLRTWRLFHEWTRDWMIYNKQWKMLRARFQSGRCCISQDPSMITDSSPLGQMRRYTLIAWPQFFLTPAGYNEIREFQLYPLADPCVSSRSGIWPCSLRDPNHIVVGQVDPSQVNEMVVTFSTRSNCCHVDSLLNSVLGPLNLCWKDRTVSKSEHTKKSCPLEFSKVKAPGPMSLFGADSFTHKTAWVLRVAIEWWCLQILD